MMTSAGMDVITKNKMGFLFILAERNPHRKGEATWQQVRN